MDAQVGYIGGDIEQPGYRRVCMGDTGREFKYPRASRPDPVLRRSLFELHHEKCFCAAC